MNRSHSFLFSLVTVAILLWAPAENISAERPPNIVLILADDLGYGDLGAYGQKRIATPNLDRMAAEGIRFTQFYAGSTVCAPSRSVLMTGKHMGRTTVRGNAGRGNPLAQTLKPEDLTIPEMLKQKDYGTALIGKWGLGEEGSTGAPTRQGFDYFFGYLNQHHAHNYYPAFLIRNEERVPLKNEVPGDGPYGTGVATRKVEYTPDLMLEETMQWLQTNRTRPFFLFFSTTIPHANNEGRDNGMEIPDDAPYSDEDWPRNEKNKAAMITRMDRDVGLILQKLKDLGVDRETLVLFSSDNGPHREGGARPEFHNSSGPLRGIKRDFYEGGIRVPLIVRWPGKIAPGQVTDHVAYQGDLFATFADLASVRPPADLDSITFLPTLLGKPSEQKKHDYLYWEFHERGFNQAVLMDGRWKAIRLGHREAPVELYDLRNDIAERNNVSAVHPELVERAKQLYVAAREENPLWPIRERKPAAN